MEAYTYPLPAINEFGGRVSAIIDLGRPRQFLAWATVTMIDPTLGTFDRDNAVVADIYTVDGFATADRISGGDHWGPPGNSENVFPGAWVGFGQRVEFWLRVFHPRDLEAYGEAVVITLDQE
jgi:hypothetical protein